MLRSCLTIAVLCASSALLTVASPAQARSQAQQDPQYDRSCASDDFDCRIGRLEARIDYLIELLEDRRDPGPRREGRGRGQDMVVEQSCTFESCSIIAARQCQNAGFARGVPAEIRTTGPWPYLVRATCSD